MRQRSQVRARSQVKVNGAARPIRTKRDYVRAGDVVDRLSDQAELESAAELRLQALIREMEKYDDEGDDVEDFSFDYEAEEGPRRRWSDDPNDLD